MGAAARSPREWDDTDIRRMARLLRQATKPIIVAANKADLCETTPEWDGAIPCSAETELVLRRAAKSGMISYKSGDGDFAMLRQDASPPQLRALSKVRSVLERLRSTGIQETLDSAVFGVLGLITAYPVEDETRLADKGGRVLPDARLLPPGSTARDLAGTVHTDIARGFLYGIDCKSSQRIGADYTVRDGDVIKIVSTASRG